jgi:hypothetical protein
MQSTEEFKLVSRIKENRWIKKHAASLRQKEKKAYWVQMYFPRFKMQREKGIFLQLCFSNVAPLVSHEINLPGYY